MKLWKNLSNRLDAVADVMAAKPCMQGCVGKTLLSIPRTPGNLITAVILAIGLLITIGRFGFGLGAVTNLDDNNPWGIWIAFYINITCGLALISQEKDILHDVLRAFPQYANLSPAKFAAAISGIIGLVLAVDSVFNTAGRVGFSTLSDHLKRRETVYQVIFIMSIAVCLLQIFTNSIGNALLWAVLAMLFLVNAGYGGGFSTLPVLLDQHFGTKTVSTTHGLTLSAWAFAGLSGNQLASFVVAHAPDQAHRYAALIPVLTGRFVVALISISLVKYLGDRNVTKAVEDRG